MGAPSRHVTVYEKQCEITLDMTPKTYDFLVRMAGRESDVKNTGCDTNTVTADLDLLIGLLEQLCPGFQSYFDLVFAVKDKVGLTNAEILLQTLQGMTPDEMRAMTIATHSNQGSGWIENATGRYGEDDGLRADPNFTNLDTL